MRRNVSSLIAVLALALLPLSQAARGEGEDQDDVLALLQPRRGEVIADVGSGRGTWTFVLARQVGPTGRVYAVDIDPDALAVVKERATREGFHNVEVIHSVPDDPLLEPGIFDAIFLNDVIDWVERRALAGFLAGIRQALKPDGRLVIRDPSGDPDRVISELYRSGFSLVEAKFPLENVPAKSFSTGWYALKLRPSRVQPAILPRLGTPARHRFQLFLLEEMFRKGLLTREELRARWEEIRDRPGPYDGPRDEALDLLKAARATGALEGDLAKTVEGRIPPAGR